MKIKICTKIIAACLTLAMFFGAMVAVPKEVKAAEEPTTICYDNGARVEKREIHDSYGNFLEWTHDKELCADYIYQWLMLVASEVRYL